MSLNKLASSKLWLASFPFCFSAVIVASALNSTSHGNTDNSANSLGVIGNPRHQDPPKPSPIKSSTLSQAQIPALENPVSCHQIEQAIDDDIRDNKQRRIHMADINRLCSCNEIKAFNSIHKTTMEIPESVVCDTETTITETHKHKKYDDCDEDDDDCDD